MVKRAGRTLAMTIILGVFVAIMLTIFVNLVVSYTYPEPDYQKYCGNRNYAQMEFPAKTIPGGACNVNCTYNKQLSLQAEGCNLQGGEAVYDYNDLGCAVSLKKCDLCNKQLTEDFKVYNRMVFFVYAIIGFALIVFGLFNPALLLQIVSLPSGAFLVIEAAVKNFDDKLYVIITFGLLIVAALYLALRKLKLN